jgi:hypothetical protein
MRQAVVDLGAAFNALAVGKLPVVASTVSSRVRSTLADHDVPTRLRA